MCGIFSYLGKSIEEEKLEEYSNKIQHRGPDNSVFKKIKNDLYISKSDENAMEKNLRDQGLEFEKMELYAKLDDEKNQFGAQKGALEHPNPPIGPDLPQQQ